MYRIARESGYYDAVAANLNYYTSKTVLNGVKTNYAAGTQNDSDDERFLVRRAINPGIPEACFHACTEGSQLDNLIQGSEILVL